MIFSPEQIQIIKQICVPHGLEETHDTPNKFRGGERPFFKIIDCNVESIEFPGLPLIAISDGIGGIQETGHGIAMIDDIRDMVKARFATLKKPQKKASAYPGKKEELKDVRGEHRQGQPHTEEQSKPPIIHDSHEQKEEVVPKKLEDKQKEEPKAKSKTPVCAICEKEVVSCTFDYIEYC